MKDLKIKIMFTIPWREIAESMGYKSVDSAYSAYTHGKERYGNVTR